MGGAVAQDVAVRAFCNVEGLSSRSHETAARVFALRALTSFPFFHINCVPGADRLSGSGFGRRRVSHDFPNVGAGDHTTEVSRAISPNLLRVRLAHQLRTVIDDTGYQELKTCQARISSSLCSAQVLLSHQLGVLMGGPYPLKTWLDLYLCLFSSAVNLLFMWRCLKWLHELRCVARSESRR